MKDKIKNYGEICVNYIRINSLAYVSDCDLRCRNCTDPFNRDNRCDDYYPIGKSQIPVRKGRNLLTLLRSL